MSYLNRSIPTDVGKYQRSILGSDLFQRAKNTIQLLQNLGIDIQHIIIPGRDHNNINGIGVNKLGEKFIYDVYKSTIDNLEIDSKISR